MFKGKNNQSLLMEELRKAKNIQLSILEDNVNSKKHASKIKYEYKVGSSSRKNGTTNFRI